MSSITSEVPIAEARTINCVEVECDNSPDVPVTFRVNVPGVVATPDADVPSNGVKGEGLNDAVTVEGPEALNVIGAVNSLIDQATRASPRPSLDDD